MLRHMCHAMLKQKLFHMQRDGVLQYNPNPNSNISIYFNTYVSTNLNSNISNLSFQQDWRPESKARPGTLPPVWSLKFPNKPAPREQCSTRDLYSGNHTLLSPESDARPGQVLIFLS